MNFPIRLLVILSLLFILFGSLVKMNHWPFEGYLYINAGVIGLGIAGVCSFIYLELKRRAENKKPD